MTDWTAFNMVFENSITYFFSDYTIFALVMSLLFLIIMVGVGMEFKHAMVFTLPIVGGFAAYGLLGNISWIVDIVLIIVGLIYAIALIKLYS
jgi:hypothetical protein